MTAKERAKSIAVRGIRASQPYQAPIKKLPKKRATETVAPGRLAPPRDESNNASPRPTPLVQQSLRTLLEKQRLHAKLQHAPLGAQKWVRVFRG